MLINNYICAINFTDIELGKNGQRFCSLLLSKDVSKRPNAKQALEDDIFCLCESSIGVDLGVLDNRFVNSGGDTEPT